MKKKTVSTIYTQTQTLFPHCSECKERLSGNGSIVTPYKCRCGIWQYDWLSQEYWVLTA